MTSALRGTGPATSDGGSTTGASAAPRRCIRCKQEPATHRVNAAGWCYRSGRRVNTHCEPCAMVLSRERAEANNCRVTMTDTSDPLADLIQKVTR